MTYRRYPSEPPRPRTVWWLIGLFVALLLANLVHQSGVA